MLYYLATRPHLYTIRWFLETAAPFLASPIVPLPYERLSIRIPPAYFLRRAKRSWGKLAAVSWSPLRPQTFRAGAALAASLWRVVRNRDTPATYVFADIERLAPWQAERAAEAWQALSEMRSPVRLLNHPTRSMRRFELLRTLHERGINRFDVYRLTEARWPARYPVFLRRENDHGGPISPLLGSRDELVVAIAELDRRGQSRDGIIVTEFCDTADVRGVYRKYGAFVVGERVIPKSVQFSQRWVQKNRDLQGEAFAREECEYLERNPHEVEVREIFRLARIDFGRMDYAIADGRIQVWEINTNPMIVPAASRVRPERAAASELLSRRLVAALAELEVG